MVTQLLVSAPQVYPPPAQVHRCLSTETEGEARIANILKEKFPLASSLKVVDISGKRASVSGGELREGMRTDVIYKLNLRPNAHFIPK